MRNETITAKYGEEVRDTAARLRALWEEVKTDELNGADRRDAFAFTLYHLDDEEYEAIACRSRGFERALIVATFPERFVEVQ